MKFILDDKYLVSTAGLSEMVEVEAFGDYSHRKYKIIGEPSRIHVVPDADIVEGEAAKQAQDEAAAVQLKRVEAELAKLRLDTARKEAVARIVAEKRGLSREDIEAWAAAQQAAYTLPNATSDDVRKWMRSQG
jgi:hypothetical protein